MLATLAVTFAAVPAAPVAPDLRFDLGTFATTSADVVAVSDKGREFLASMFGAGCVGVTLPKSKADDFARFAAQKSIAVEVA